MMDSYFTKNGGYNQIDVIDKDLAKKIEELDNDGVNMDTVFVVKSGWNHAGFILIWKNPPEKTENNEE